MNELKTRITALVNKVNQNWVNAIEEAEEKGEGQLELSGIFGEFSKNMVELDDAFQEAAGRIKPSKSKGKWDW